MEQLNKWGLHFVAEMQEVVPETQYDLSLSLVQSESETSTDDSEVPDMYPSAETSDYLLEESETTGVTVNDPGDDPVGSNNSMEGTEAKKSG